MKEIASISLLVLKNGEPGVRLSAGDEFMEAAPVDRVSLLVAAIQLCGAAITAICDDNPDDKAEIMEVMESMTIAPSGQAIN